MIRFFYVCILKDFLWVICDRSIDKTHQIFLCDLFLYALTVGFYEQVLFSNNSRQYVLNCTVQDSPVHQTRRSLLIISMMPPLPWTEAVTTTTSTKGQSAMTCGSHWNQAAKGLGCDIESTTRRTTIVMASRQRRLLSLVWTWKLTIIGLACVVQLGHPYPSTIYRRHFSSYSSHSLSLYPPTRNIPQPFQRLLYLHMNMNMNSDDVHSTLELAHGVLLNDVDVPQRTEAGGYTHTIASKAKISAANKGKVPWNKGMHRSDEVKARIAEGVRRKNRERFLQQLANRGLTEEQYEDQKREEQRLKDEDKLKRKTAKGGYRATDETKAKISSVLKEKYANGNLTKKAYHGPFRKGFTHSEETKEKIRITLKKKWAEVQYTKIDGFIYCIIVCSSLGLL